MTPLRRILAWTGGLALLAATGIDTLAALGRHIGFPLRGSIELIQVAILVASGVAILAATMAGAHARAVLVVERMGARARLLADRGNEILTAVFYGAVLAGSGWIAADLWRAHEVSELVGAPWRWMRLAANLLLLAAVVAALVRVRGKRS